MGRRDGVRAAAGGDRHVQWQAVSVDRAPAQVRGAAVHTLGGWGWRHQQHGHRRAGGGEGAGRARAVRPLQGGLLQFVFAADPSQTDGPPLLQGLEPQRRPRPVLQGGAAAGGEIPSWGAKNGPGRSCAALG